MTILTLTFFLVAGCAGETSQGILYPCEITPIGEVDASDDSIGYSAQDVIDALNATSWQATWEDDTLYVPEFTELEIDWELDGVVQQVERADAVEGGCHGIVDDALSWRSTVTFQDVDATFLATGPMDMVSGGLELEAIEVDSPTMAIPVTVIPEAMQTRLDELVPDGDWELYAGMNTLLDSGYFNLEYRPETGVGLLSGGTLAPR